MKVRRQYRLRVRQRLMILHFAGLHGPTAAGRRFGVAVGTIQRVFRDIGLPRVRRTRKRAPRQMKLFEKAEPGETIQIDVKFVKIAGRWAFQYTALDDCTRFRVLRLYRRLHQSSSLAFLAELCLAFPSGSGSCRATTDYLQDAAPQQCAQKRDQAVVVLDAIGHTEILTPSIGRLDQDRVEALTNVYRDEPGLRRQGRVLSHRGPPLSSECLEPGCCTSERPLFCRYYGHEFRLPLCSRSRHSELNIATSGHGGRSRTGRSNAVTGLTRRNSGVAADSIRSQRPPRASAPGKGTTTTNASHWLYKGGRRPKSLPLSCPPPRANAGADYYSNDAQGQGQS